MSGDDRLWKKLIVSGNLQYTVGFQAECGMSEPKDKKKIGESAQGGANAPPSFLKIIQEEAQIIENEADWSATEQANAANTQSHLNVYLGLPTTLLAAIAGASALSKFENSGLLAGGLAIAVAGLAALSTFLNPDEKAARHLTASMSYAAVARDARMFKSVTSPLCKSQEQNELIEALTSLEKRITELDKSSPLVGNSWRARDYQKYLEEEDERADRLRHERKMAEIARHLQERALEKSAAQSNIKPNPSDS